MMKRIQIVLLLIAGCLSYPAAAQTAAPVMPQRGLCAHRGASETHPENTLPAFMEAIAAGAQMIEFDVQLTKDSVLVIMHDETVDRTTNGTGKVSTLTLQQLKLLDAGSKKGAQFTGTRVPALDEVLAIMPRNVWLNCHIKGDAATAVATAQKLAAAQRLHQAFLACGEEGAAAARAAVPGIRICNMESKYRKEPEAYARGTIALHAGFLQLVQENQLQPGLIAALKENHVRINYFYARNAAEVAQLLAAGVDFVLVNNITAAMSAAAEKGITPVRPQF